MNFNLSSWALRNRQLVLYFMLVLAVAGVLSYGQLGQSEDPPFTFKAMVVTTQWPGATAEEVAQQISDRIEQKVMETGDYQQVVSYSRPGSRPSPSSPGTTCRPGRFRSSGTSCARRSAISAIPCRRISSVPSTTTSSAPLSATSMP